MISIYALFLFLNLSLYSHTLIQQNEPKADMKKQWHIHVSTTNRTAINSSYTNDSLCLILRNAQIELCFPSLAIFIRSVPKAKIQEEDRELKKNKVQFFDLKRKRNQNKNETIKNNIHTNTNTRTRKRRKSLQRRCFVVSPEGEKSNDTTNAWRGMNKKATLSNLTEDIS